MKTQRKILSHILSALILTVFFSVQIQASNVPVLEKRISLNVANEKIKSVLRKIENIGDVSFSYNVDLVQIERKISLNANNEPLRIVLRKALNDSTLQYKSIDNLIVIYRPDAYNNFLQVEGLVVDKESGEPITFANVAIAGENIGTISDEDGSFSIKIDKQFNENTLGVSFVGYETCYIPINDLDNAKLVIELASKTFDN